MQASAMPSITSEKLHITSGRSGEAKFRQFVTAIGRRSDADNITRCFGNGKFRTFARVDRGKFAVSIEAHRDRTTRFLNTNYGGIGTGQ